MKTRIHGLVAVATIVFAVALAPLSAMAGDHGGWGHHDHGNHWGWYKHHGGYGYGGYGAPGYAYGGNPGGWHCHHHGDWDDAEGGYGGQAYGAYAPSYGGYGYSGSPMMAPSALSYPPYGSGYGSYAPMGNLGNMGKMMRRQQLASQRLTANQNLYQAAMAQGNYALANKAAAHMQKQSGILNATNGMFGTGAAPVYSGYGVPNYGATPYYGQPGYGAMGASPLSSILQMLP